MNVFSRLSAIVRTIGSCSAAALVVFPAACVTVSRVDVPASERAETRPEEWKPAAASSGADRCPKVDGLYSNVGKSAPTNADKQPRLLSEPWGWQPLGKPPDFVELTLEPKILMTLFLWTDFPDQRVERGVAMDCVPGEVVVNKWRGAVAIGGSFPLPPARQFRFSLLDDGDLLLNYVTAEGAQRSSWYRFEKAEKTRTSASK